MSGLPNMERFQNTPFDTIRRLEAEVEQLREQLIESLEQESVLIKALPTIRRTSNGDVWLLVKHAMINLSELPPITRARFIEYAAKVEAMNPPKEQTK